MKKNLTKYLTSSIKKSGEQIAEEKWFEQVTNPNTGEFIQLEDLKGIGAVPTNFKAGEKSKKYHIKTVDCIIGIKKS